jgi:putative ABC transport system substrate-binding protein
MAALGYVEDESIVYELHDAGGERDQLDALAQAIVDAQVDVGIAAGGLEADALKAATQDVELPVVFLAVSSTVSRGLVKNMQRSGNHLTGVDTNDTALTAKRMEWIARMLPEARNVLILNVPSITPSAESTAVAAGTAPGLGLSLTVIDVEDGDDIRQALTSLPDLDVDAILALPSAPLRENLRTVIYPASLAEGIPIFGVNRQDLARGAIAAYAGSRYEMGAQAAQLVQKVLTGISTRDLPVETPDHVELVINRTTVSRLGLTLPDEIWDVADKVVEQPVED